MKSEPKAVYMKKNNQYEELSYEEYINSGQAYKDKKFLFLHGVLMEVDEDTYKDYYKTRRRQKYLIEQAIKNGDISYDMLTTDECNGENILNSGIQDISETVIHKIMLDRLRGCLSFLSETDRQLLESIYFKEMSEREFSKISGIPQRTVNDRKRRILAKLKKYLEN